MKSVKHRAFLLATIFPLILLLGNNADAHDNKKVHPYIATAAKAVWPPQGTVAYEEMSNYLGPLTYYDGDCDSAHSGESITEGAFEEDIYNSLADLCSNDWPWGRSFTTHFYDCDKPEPMNGLDLYEPSYGALWQAQAYMNYAKYYYTKDKPDKPLAYWYLGKIAHLLADVSVPAHVHNDPHGGPPEELLGGFDSYEKYMAENYSKWNHTHAGSIDEIPAHSTLDDIFYNLGQITQYFPSDNADGNGKNLDDSIEEKLEDLNGCQYFDVDETNSKLSEMKIHDDDLETIGNYLMPRAIKYTAALYRLFWQEVHPVNPTIAQTPMEGPMGTSCRQWGTGFTPNSQGKFYFQLGDGSGDYDWFWQPMDGDGHFDIPYVFNKPPGQYKWYVEDVTGEKSNEVTYTITGSTDASTPSAYPSSGTWTSTPINISVSCGNADRIYCKVTTAFGSMPEDPPTPTIESHDIFDTGVEYIGSSGTFKLWGQTGQIKYIKVRFRGYNNSSGYGPTTGVYQYAIDLRDWDPGDDGTTEGPDGNVKKVEIDATGNNWHHSYNAYPGMSLESRVTVTNKGDEIIDYFEVTIYRSDDLNFNPDLDYSYGREEEEEDLYPGDKDHKHRTITAPSTPG
ncbi:MAG: hypothetical protein K9M96_12900, partial [Deltaproteobacteria bacterium]|nr:hypothetical protein [Deltaproteobacteria bacterium]